MLYVGQRTIDSGLKKRSVARRVIFGPVTIKFVAIALLVVFSFFYYVQSNASTEQYYTISDLQEQKEKAEAVNSQLQVDAERQRALSIIEQKANEKGMEPISQ